MLRLSELVRVARVVDRDFAGSRVERWIQPDASRLVVTLYGRDPASGDAHKRHLLFCVDGNLARIAELPAPPAAPAEPPAFCAYLRAHLGRARIAAADILDEDRQLRIRLEAKEGGFDLLLSLFGRRTNVYLLDADRKLLASLRPLRDTRPELSIGAPFASPSGGPPTAGEDRFADVEDPDLLEAIERYYADEEAEQGAADLGRRLSRAIGKEYKNAERRLARVESELAEADDASRLKRDGDLLKGSLGSVAPGASEVTLPDWETGEDVVIPLDPAKTAAQNLEALFKRYRKLIRRLTKAGGQHDEALRRRDELAALDARLRELVARSEEAEVAAELEALAARPEIARLLDRGPRGGVAKARDEGVEKKRLPASLQSVPPRLVPRRFLSRDGLEIWVGRSDAGNDYLSTRLARGKDLFFHVEGFPGSHVVLRTEGRSDPPAESLLEACELAVRFSKQRNAKRIDVHVVPIKNVKKPKGAKPGLVYVTGGRTIHLRREEERLERILAARIES